MRAIEVANSILLVGLFLNSVLSAWATWSGDAYDKTLLMIIWGSIIAFWAWSVFSELNGKKEAVYVRNMEKRDL